MHDRDYLRHDDWPLRQAGPGSRSRVVGLGGVRGHLEERAAASHGDVCRVDEQFDPRQRQLAKPHSHNGPPDCWPHVLAALERAGFSPGERTELVLVADVADLPRGGPPPLPDLELRRELGTHATRFAAVLDGRVVGIHDVQADLTNGGTLSRLAGWADVWELIVDESLRRRGIATWLVGHAAGWLRLAGARSVLGVAMAGQDDAPVAFARRLGQRELFRARRGWQRDA